MALPELATPQAPASVRTPAPTHRTRATTLPEVRWAALAALAFLAALPLDLAGAPAWLLGPLYAICYAAGGWEPACAGLQALRERSLDVDLLMVVAALGAAAIGQYLDGGLLIVIFAVSGALEALATRRTADSVRGLLDLAPATAVRLTAGDSAHEETVEAADLAVGDTVLVRPGERLPADGTVLRGTSDVDQASITGEPLPVPKAAGDTVFAGTLNGSGALRVRVDKDAADSVIARIVALVEEASATKAPTQLFVEKIEQRYSVGVVVATLALFGLPVALGADVTEALLRAMTFMIVASPCAVVLATMPPLLCAIATAGRHGVLVKSAVVMERLGAVDRVALDKTGTLTEGTPTVTAVHGDASALALAAAAELPSEHPLARAVVAEARARGLDIPEASAFDAEPGRGVRAVVGGREVRVRRAAGHHADTAVEVVVDGAVAAVLDLSDRLRDGAPEAVAALARLTGRAPTLLTGDNAGAAARIAAEAGIDDVRAGLLPHEKAEAVREWERAGARVLLVGDGVNDAPALAAAHTGIAMGRAGSDLALDTADAVVVRDELRAIPAVVALSRRARRLVVQNLWIAGVCIGALVVWDLAGHLPLPLGVAGHEGSTVLVGLNGLRLLRDAAWRRASPVVGGRSAGAHPVVGNRSAGAVPTRPDGADAGARGFRA
ncbi:heavy metal translocating P-type ATPase [Streptomyces sp. R44]|uniref:Heavy metal translocating P-type ATPase n=1 Tax=Streptomyces sp. R44 TaxID=3238633 RepID=A0AB39SRD1_9ACTN